MCWGTGHPSQSSLPITAPGQELFAPATPIQIVSGYIHHLVLLSDGTVWGYGSNGDGQIGEGLDWAESFHQVSIGGQALKDVEEIFAGGYHSCVKRTDGSLTCFGLDNHGHSSGPTSVFNGDSSATKAKLVATGQSLSHVSHSLGPDITNIDIITTLTSHRWRHHVRSQQRQ